VNTDGDMWRWLAGTASTAFLGLFSFISGRRTKQIDKMNDTILKLHDDVVGLSATLISIDKQIQNNEKRITENKDMITSQINLCKLTRVKLNSNEDL